MSQKKLFNRNSIEIPDGVKDAIISKRDEPFEALIRDETEIKNAARFVCMLPAGYERMWQSDYGKGLLSSRVWRVSNLYFFPHIDDKSEILVDWDEPYLREILESIWGKETTTLKIAILKTRQVYVTTAICCLMLDLCAFSRNMMAGISNYNEEDVKKTLKDKVYYAFEHSPVLHHIGVESMANGIRFPRTNSQLEVEQTGRGRTLSFSLLTEFAKTAEFAPSKAEEIMRGLGPAIGFRPFIIESSSQGPGGKFYNICMNSYQLKKEKRKLDPTQFNFIFIPWWRKKRNTYPYTSFPEDLKTYKDYFTELERENGTIITPGQRNWWVSEFRSTAANDLKTMRQEYPGSVEEAFKVESEAYIMAPSVDEMLKDGRYHELCAGDHPVICFWDFGWVDHTAFALFQAGPGGYLHCIYAYSAQRQLLSHFFNMVRGLNYNIAWHVLPHDANALDRKAEHLTQTRGSIYSFFQAAGLHNIHTLRRQTDKKLGFLASRQIAPNVKICSRNAYRMFDSLQGVKRKFNKAGEFYMDELEPRNECNHLYDCFEGMAYCWSDNPELFQPVEVSKDILADATLYETSNTAGAIIHP